MVCDLTLSLFQHGERYQGVAQRWPREANRRCHQHANRRKQRCKQQVANYTVDWDKSFKLPGGCSIVLAVANLKTDGDAATASSSNDGKGKKGGAHWSDRWSHACTIYMMREGRTGLYVHRYFMISWNNYYCHSLITDRRMTAYCMLYTTSSCVFSVSDLIIGFFSESQLYYIWNN